MYVPSIPNAKKTICQPGFYSLKNAKMSNKRGNDGTKFESHKNLKRSIGANATLRQAFLLRFEAIFVAATCLRTKRITLSGDRVKIVARQQRC